jgi:predicted PurR-regulated permease PerM
MTPLRWTTLALCIAAAFVVWPLWPPLVLAAWTAALTRPLLVRFERALKGRRRAAAALSLLLFVVLALPLALVSLGVFTGGQELLATVRTSTSAASALQTLTSSPDATLRLPSSFPEVVSLIQAAGTQGLGVLTGLAGAAANGLVGLFLYFGGAYTFLLDSSAAWAWVKRRSPLEPGHLQRLGDAFHETGRGLLVGVGLTSLTQGLAATAIYLALGVPRAWVLGPLTGLASVVPVVGTALVWGPTAVGFYLTDRPGRALVLVLLGVGFISVIDNLLRPIYARLGALQMPMFLLFVAVFGGLATFGPWGALLGPLVLRLGMEALAIAREPGGEDELQPGPQGEGPTGSSRTASRKASGAS